MDSLHASSVPRPLRKSQPEEPSSAPLLAAVAVAQLLRLSAAASTCSRAAYSFKAKMRAPIFIALAALVAVVAAQNAVVASVEEQALTLTKE
jgi:hypothetical protein